MFVKKLSRADKPFFLLNSRQVSLLAHNGDRQQKSLGNTLPAKFKLRLNAENCYSSLCTWPRPWGSARLSIDGNVVGRGLIPNSTIVDSQQLRNCDC